MNQDNPKPRILRLKLVIAQTGLSRSTIYERMNEKSFPSAINLGGRTVGWLEHEIEDWINSQIQRSRTVRVR